MSIEFHPDSELGAALGEWWSEINEDRGARAELRRCDRAVQVVMTPVFQRQLRAWRPHFAGQSFYEDRLAQIVGLLAHVRFNQPGAPIAVQMATGRGGGTGRERTAIPAPPATNT